ncbi:Hypothetical Protein XCAW_01949 [Xanthomonas citri subsp. citri Aw12879]|nr:Hypothetical Protein XCAW_01949 [Xanthomonas citri subsp. citri Aw12879]
MHSPRRKFSSAPPEQGSGSEEWSARENSNPWTRGDRGYV